MDFDAHGVLNQEPGGDNAGWGKQEKARGLLTGSRQLCMPPQQLCPTLASAETLGLLQYAPV